MGKEEKQPNEVAAWEIRRRTRGTQTSIAAANSQSNPIGRALARDGAGAYLSIVRSFR